MLDSVNPYIENIKGKKTVLERLKKKDLKKCLKWFKDPDINKFLKQNIKGITYNQELEWYNFIEGSSKDIVFSINTKPGNIYIGNCGIHKINYQRSTCELGIVIGEKSYWGKGYGSDAVKNAVYLIINKLKIKNIRLNVYEYNHRAISTYRKCGFKKTRVLEKSHFYNKKYWDTIIMEYKDL